MSKAQTLARAVSTGSLLSDGTLSQQEVTTALGYTPESSANKNQNNGYAGLDGSGKVASAQLPSYVDDVLESANSAALPVTGETGKIYITLDNNKVYRWSGSTYVEIVATPGSTDSVTEGSTNLYYTDTRARSAVSATSASGVGYNSSTGVFSLSSIPNSSLTNSAITINGTSISLGGSTTLSIAGSNIDAGMYNSTYEQITGMDGGTP